MALILLLAIEKVVNPGIYFLNAQSENYFSYKESSLAVGDTCKVVVNQNIVDGHSSVEHPHSQLARVVD